MVVTEISPLKFIGNLA